MFTALGNHDFQTDCGSYDCGKAGIYYRYFPYPKAGDEIKDAYYWFQYGPAHFWSIDTWPMNGDTYCGPCDNMKNTSAQYQWFEQTLQSIENNPRQWKIVFMHAPFYDADRSCNLQDGRDYFKPLFEKYGVDMVLAGHEHYYARKSVNGIPYLVLGGGGAGLSPMNHPEDVDVAHKKHHFAYFKITEDVMEVQVIDSDNNVIDEFTLDRFPTANFDAKPAVGSSRTYQFTDKSTGHRYQYLWEFGDGETSTERNPTHIYAASGVYTVKLTISSLFNSHFHTQTIDISKADTTTTITSDSPDPSVVGQPYTVNWQVTADPGSGTPTGTVTVSDGTNSYCSAPVEAGSCDLTSTAPGQYWLLAHYSGDGLFNSSSGTSEHFVNYANTTTTITSDTPDPTVVGQPYTVNWTVTVNPPGSGTPTGYVHVWDSGGGKCTVPVEAGSCNPTPSEEGDLDVHVFYSGNAKFNSSEGVAEHQVNKADTTTVITSTTPNPSVVGQPYSVNWSVTVNPPGSGTPTGDVIVEDGWDSCEAPVETGTCNIIYTKAGTRTVTATYFPKNNMNFNPSSGTASHTVNKTDTTTTITSDSPDPSVVGQSYSVNWTVTVSPPGSGTPTGTVTVSDGTNNCSAAVGAGACNLTSTTAGVKTLTATYSGDTNFNSSSGTASHTVNRANTTTTLNSSPNPSLYGQEVTLTATVIGGTTGMGIPTGTVTFRDGTAVLGSTTLSGGIATLTTSSLEPGSRLITAEYGGDEIFNPSTSAALIQEVNPFDLALLDDYGRSKLSVDTLTGDWSYSILIGSGAGNTYTGRGVIVWKGGVLWLNSLDSERWGFNLIYNTSLRKGMATFGDRATGIRSSLVCTTGPMPKP